MLNERMRRIETLEYNVLVNKNSIEKDTAEINKLEGMKELSNNAFLIELSNIENKDALFNYRVHGTKEGCVYTIRSEVFLTESQKEILEIYLKAEFRKIILNVIYL